MQNEVQYDLDRKAAKISALPSNNLEKYENLTGEDLGLKPSTVEEAKFESSPLGKVLLRGWMKMIKKGFFKRLKNIKGKIKDGNKKKSEPIKNEEQSDAIKDKSTMADKKPKEIVLLKDKVDYILQKFGSRFNSTGKYFPKRLPKDEKEIHYNYLFSEIDDKSVVKSVDFLEEIGILYDSLIYLLENSKMLLMFMESQLDLAKAITVLEIVLTNIKK